MDDDYFAGALSAQGPTPSTSPPVSAVSADGVAATATRASRQPYTRSDYAVLAGFATLGVAATVVWWGLGHPITGAFRWGFEVGLGVAVLIALVSPVEQRRRRFGVVAAGVFIGSGMVSITSALLVLAAGTSHVGRAVAHLGYGALAVAFFGGLPLLAQRNLRHQQPLPPELAAKARALVLTGRSYQRVHLVLSDGRHVPGVITDTGHLARAPKEVGVTASIRDILPAPRR